MLKGEVGRCARKRGWFDHRRAPLSNVLMTGGKLYIPAGDYDEFFLPAYARDISSGVEHFIIERATEKSRWFADFDCPSHTRLDDAEWEAVVRELQDVLTSSAGQRSGVLVLKAMGGGPLDKTGLHFVAPDVVATMQTMLEWRARMITVLNRHRPDVVWADIFDEAVYKGGSLRMALSSKMVPCTAQTHDAKCCGGTLRVNAGRRYEPHMFFGKDGCRNKQTERVLSANTQLVVSKASIRRGEQTHEPQRSAKRRRVPDAPADGGRLDDVIEGLPPEHRDLRIVDRRGSRLRVGGAGARYCTVAGREHRSSTVYYVVNGAQQTATQYCWCRKGDCPSRGGVTLCLRSRGVLPRGFVWA